MGVGHDRSVLSHDNFEVCRTDNNDNTYGAAPT